MLGSCHPTWGIFSLGRATSGTPRCSPSHALLGTLDVHFQPCLYRSTCPTLVHLLLQDRPRSSFLLFKISVWQGLVQGASESD